MSTKKLHYFKDLRKGKYDWKVQARILNDWRGFSTKGEPFKAFNLLLLDAQRGRIHAFIPGDVAEKFESKFELGKIYLIENFTVKDYKMEDKFRPLRKEIQIVFGDDTNLKKLPEDAVGIELCWFDFYDLGDLKPLSQQNTYLADVIGVLEDHDPIGKVKNRRGIIQPQFKFNITDGRTSVQVTLWDEFAQMLADCLKRDMEHPVIMILGCARVTMWQDDVILGNVGATTFYLNYNHHSVTELRKRCSKPGFSKKSLSTKKNKAPMLYKVKDLQQLGHNHMEIEVLCEVNLMMVHNIKTWCHPVCTSCYQKIERAGITHICAGCDRVVPYADLRFEIYAIASDETGKMDIKLQDREVRTLIGKTVFELLKEGHKVENWPNVFQTLENKNCTVKIKISEGNVEKKQEWYLATDIMEGLNYLASRNLGEESYPHPISESEPQASGSSFHLSAYSTFRASN